MPLVKLPPGLREASSLIEEGKLSGPSLSPGTSHRVGLKASDLKVSLNLSSLQPPLKVVDLLWASVSPSVMIAQR